MIRQYMDKIKESIDGFLKNVGIYNERRLCDERWKDYAEGWINKKNEKLYEIMPAYVNNTINFPEPEKTEQYTLDKVMMA